MFSILLTAGIATLQPLQSDLAPLSFLVGHCWRGPAPGKGVDTHCFAIAKGGVRDHHDVVVDGKTVYWGDTDFRWDAATRSIHYRYTSPAGHMEGKVRSIPDGLDFGRTEFVPAGGGQILELIIKWTRVGDKAYDAFDALAEGSGPSVPRRFTRLD